MADLILIIYTIILLLCVSAVIFLYIKNKELNELSQIKNNNDNKGKVTSKNDIEKKKKEIETKLQEIQTKNKEIDKKQKEIELKEKNILLKENEINNKIKQYEMKEIFFEK